mmetsp:Transcript_13375/g.46294  ORF Transcript_13375/g.46294 Transcript_13375/m.46294 type:complete len:216 (+) Transcript_13375:89-736(+)
MVCPLVWGATQRCTVHAPAGPRLPAPSAYAKCIPLSLNAASSLRKSSSPSLDERACSISSSSSIPMILSLKDSASPAVPPMATSPSPPAAPAPSFPCCSARITRQFSCSISTTVFVRKMPLSVLFLRPKQSLTRPSHSLKFTGGGGLRGSMRTTELSTFGGGRKQFLPTFSRWLTRESSCVLTLSRQYIGSPGGATSRMANSRWYMMMAARKKGL